MDIKLQGTFTYIYAHVDVKETCAQHIFIFAVARLLLYLINKK